MSFYWYMRHGPEATLVDWLEEESRRLMESGVMERYRWSRAFGYEGARWWWKGMVE